MKLKVLSTIAVIVSTIVSLQSQTVTTFAGAGVRGYSDGPALSAKFAGLEQMAYDRNGNLLICDAANNCIRKMDINGNVTTFAGNGNPGLVNGDVATAQFNNPLGIAVDNYNNVYVADNLNFVIRKIDPTGNVTTYAGSGKQGYSDGNSSSAQFDYVNYICLDNSMNLYVADPNNNVIRKIDRFNNVTTFVGSGKVGFTDGMGTSAELSFPIDITYDKANNVFYVSDQGNSAIRKVLPDGTLSTYAGTGKIGYQDGEALTAQFYFPKGITVDNVGNVYVAGRFDYTVRKIDTEGNVSTIAGIPHITGNVNGIGSKAIFGKPINVLMCSDGNLLVSDWVNNSVRKIELPLTASVNNTSQKDFNMKATPNPFNTSTTITVPDNKGTESINVSVYDVTGKEVKTKNTVSGQQIIIDRGNLSNGIYFYSLLQGKNVIGTGKLIVQ